MFGLEADGLALARIRIAEDAGAKEGDIYGFATTSADAAAAGLVVRFHVRAVEDAGTREAAAPAPKDVGVVGEGFYLDVPVWHRTDTSVQTGLTAKYKWGSSDERIAKGMSGGSYWRLAFPDRPKPNDIAKIELELEFELTNEDKATIAKTTEVVIGEASTSPPDRPRSSPPPSRSPRSAPPTVGEETRSFSRSSASRSEATAPSSSRT